ncbi:MAG TPA: type II toxin-antitoxin system PemK/MazF family toxin [Tepidisphaeraceae bacterium]|jgi:mRNA interferase MazF|nr:type II toxin-antitoxin system PemK/MazF family toxin [Tepidisphaeraceae bacterium]
MTTCDPGAIVLVHFPFTNLSSTKRRPALVVSSATFAARYGDVVVLALTSQNQNDPSLHWRAAGLPKPTWVKPLIGTLSA